MSNKLSIITILFVAAFSMSCSQNKKSEVNIYDSRPEVQAAASIQSSFQAPAAQKENAGDLSVDQKNKLTILKSALDKEFLFQVFLTPQLSAPMGNGLKSRVVSFVQKADKVYLLEATQGHQAIKEFPQSLILAGFPISAETDDSITFDFNAGFDGLYMMGEWYSSDYEGSSYNSEKIFEHVKAQVSYVDRAQIQENALVIEQVAQLIQKNKEGVETIIPNRITYMIEPYRANKNFSPTQSPGFDVFGFFEAAPLLQLNGAALVNASKFGIGADQSQPIVFSLSSNTPEKYKQAVRDGILYWNKAFGKEVVRVEDAPAGVMAPDLRRNILQWVDWDDADFAYADAQLDPRTGEIRRAQVYMTSVFAFNTRVKVEKLLRSWKNKPASQALVKLQGFELSQNCRYGQKRLVEALQKMLQENATDEQIEKASMDSIRETVAHEVGHTLGLRHNFAGTQAAKNYEIPYRTQHLKNYFSNGQTDRGMTISSSVMDYHPMFEALQVGDLIAKDSKALEYDEKAIRTLYLNQKYSRSEVPLFCTDSHQESGKYLDCQQFDYGVSTIEFAKAEKTRILESLPQQLLNTYINAVAPKLGSHPLTVEEVKLPAFEDFANIATAPLAQFLNHFVDGKGLLKFRRGIYFENPQSMEDILSLEQKHVASELSRVGGIENSLNYELNPEVLSNEFNRLLELNTKVTGAGGQTYEFSETEKQIMKDSVKKYFAMWVASVRLNSLLKMSSTFSDTANLKDDASSDDLAGAYSHLQDQYALALSEEKLEGTVDTEPEEGKVQANQVQVFKFKYPLEVRLAAMQTLKGTKAKGIDWAFGEKIELKQKLKKTLKAAVGVEDMSKVKTATASNRELRKWLLEFDKMTAE